MNYKYLNFHNCFKELKFRFFLSLIFLFNFLILGFLKKESLIGLVLVLGEQNNFIFTKATELFMICIRLLESLTVKFLYFCLLNHFFSLIFSGFRSYEKIILKKTYFYFIFIYFFSFFLSSFLVFPKAWSFFVKTSNVNLIFDKFLFFEASLESYISFYSKTFDLTLFGSFLILIGFLVLQQNPKKFKNRRKEIFLLFLLFSTVLTPPDVSSQVFFCFFLNFWYEIILVGCICVNNLKR